MEQAVLKHQKDSLVPVEVVDKDDYRLSTAYYQKVRDWLACSCVAPTTVAVLYVLNSQVRSE